MTPRAARRGDCALCHDLPVTFTEQECPACKRCGVDVYKLSPDEFGKRIGAEYSNHLRKVMRRFLRNVKP